MIYSLKPAYERSKELKRRLFAINEEVKDLTNESENLTDELAVVTAEIDAITNLIYPSQG